MRKKEENTNEIAKLENLIALVYLYRNDLHNALLFSELSVINAREGTNAKVLRNCYETYSTILQESADYEMALIYYKKYLDIRDSILMEDKVVDNLIVQERAKIEAEVKPLEKKMMKKRMRVLEVKKDKINKMIIAQRKRMERISEVKDREDDWEVFERMEEEWKKIEELREERNRLEENLEKMRMKLED